MAKWIDVRQAAALVDMDEAPFWKLVKYSNNPPPFVRPSERTILFDSEALLRWRDGWLNSGSKTALSA